MNLLLAFSPFVAFVVLERLVGVAAGLATAAAVSLALVLRDAFGTGRHVKLLELGSLALFGGLAALAAFSVQGPAAWSVLSVRLWVDVGLCVIVLASIVAGRPFTLPYAKERVAAEVWGSERFMRTNKILSMAWLLAFVVIVLADLLMLYAPGVPLAVGIGLTVVALGSAFKFSRWYPDRLARSASEVARVSR